MKSVWSNERTELLTKLWHGGLSASEIARRLRFVSRSAVLGKVHRMGLPLRNSTKVERAPKKPRSGKHFVFGGVPSHRTAPGLNAATLAAAPVPAIPSGERVPLANLKSHHCRFPLGQPGDPDFGFCGRQKVPGLSYCPGHHVLTHVPRSARSPRWDNDDDPRRLAFIAKQRRAFMERKKLQQEKEKLYG